MSDMSNPGSQVKKNAILVYTEFGFVWHKYMPETVARDYLDKCTAAGDGASMFVVDDAELVFSVSPYIRHRVEVVKSKLRRDLRIKAALDKHGVTQDRDTRIAVIRAIHEIYG
jgi:hypothetical protein